MESLKTIYKVGLGPSSSHTIGPNNAIRQFLAKYDVDYVLVTLYGSLALTGKGHLTDTVIINALNEQNIAHEVKFDFKTGEEQLRHPNTLKFDGYKDKQLLKTEVIYSVGGGNIVIEGEEEQASVDDVYPHSLYTDIVKFCKSNNLTLIDYIDQHEDDLDNYLSDILDVMLKSVENGITTSGEIQGDLHLSRRAKLLYENANDDKELLLSAYAYAVSEENATGGEIVTAPTCGAAGVLPANIYYYYQSGVSRKRLITGLKVAGLIGTLIRHNASISGAEAGCQAEVGSGTAMTAAAIIAIEEGISDFDMIEHAAEIGLEHSLGLTCDPVLGYVQIPCIQRNAVSAVKAQSCAKIAKVSSNLEVVDFDTIVKVMYETGKDLMSGYRETSTHGLAKYFNKNK